MIQLHLKGNRFFPVWDGFNDGIWVDEVNVRDFIQKNYSPYDGNREFLAEATERTKKLWEKVCELTKEENAKGILDVETRKPSTIISHGPGYIDRELEQIVGLQTDAPLKRGIMPNG
ncbi:MAG: formate acetyltransferase, partial [Defluviitaleaceae bacterium]|nr:formate acetyltransferase [Defluviitaleaceae bacterium]